MNKGIITICLLTLCCLITNIGYTQEPKNDDEARKMLKDYFKELHSPTNGGAAIAMVKDGEVVFQTAYGMANLEYDIPNEVNTVFHAASLSKQFTAYAALLLEQQGKLSMEDDVRKYIPEAPDFGKKITLRHLANHLSGLRDQWRLLHLAGWRIEDVILNEDILKLVENQKDLNFEPGTKVMYSNTGFTLLAEVVARVSGQTFAEFTQEQIFKPLGMTNSQFYDDYQKVVKNRAYSYQKDGDLIKKNHLNFSTVGATSLFTTVVDLCKWGIHLNTLHESNPTLAQKMNQQAKLNNGETTEAANGQWGGVKFQGLEWFDHTGSDASYRAYFSRFPEHNAVAVILANATPIEASGLALGVAEVFLSKHFKKTGDKENQAAAIKAREATYNPISLSTQELLAFCGKYWEPEERYDRTIKLINDTLVYYRSESSQTRLMPVGKNEFKMLGDDNDVSVFFEKNGQGDPAMRLNINDERTVNFLKYNPEFKLKDYAGVFYSPEVQNTVEVSTKDEVVYLKLFRQEPIALQKVKKDLFKSSDRHFKKIVFIRNARGKIIHLLITNGGATNVRFDKTLEMP